MSIDVRWRQPGLGTNRILGVELRIANCHARFSEGPSFETDDDG